MAEVKKRFLFVDDEERILQGIRRALRPMHDEWEMEFITDASQALDLVHRAPPHVVVSDLRMPGMGGTEFLRRLQKYYPSCVRIVLSGHADRDDVMGLTGCVHQFLSKPISTKLLRRVLSRASRMSALLATEELRTVISRLETLPSQPSTYRDLMREIKSPHSTAQSVGAIVSHDAAMSSKLLQLVNSSFFTLGQSVASIEQAVNLLGLDTIQALALNQCLFEIFEARGLSGERAQELWQHMESVASVSGEIARSLGTDQGIREAAFAGGLLHDIGRLILLAEFQDKFAEAQIVAESRKIDIAESEKEIVGATHAEMGAYLLGLWGLPDALVDCALYHHQPSNYKHEQLDAFIIVYIANALVDEVTMRKGRQLELDGEILDKYGLHPHLESWKKYTKTVCSKVLTHG